MTKGTLVVDIVDGVDAVDGREDAGSHPFLNFLGSR
jgi:hypothetical protein